MEEEQNKEGLVNIVMGTIAGAVQSLINPAYLPNTLTREREEIKMFEGRYAYPKIAEFGSYLLGASFLLNNIAENPSNPWAYVPIATNIIGGILGSAHDNMRVDNVVSFLEKAA